MIRKSLVIIKPLSVLCIPNNNNKTTSLFKFHMIRLCIMGKVPGREAFLEELEKGEKVVNDPLQIIKKVDL